MARKQQQQQQPRALGVEAEIAEGGAEQGGGRRID